MTTLRALIVDDSKTAQHKLSKHLKAYDLEVDTAISAEEALGYLTYTMPAVIFMDHHMEGMDGLEALKTIKANPTTATIPVIMYTAQSGDVYAGQAHALGALDIISKEIMHPATIESALAKLSINPKEKEATTQQAANTEVNSVDLAQQPLRPAAQPTLAAANDVEQSTVNTNELKAQVARLFELHIADVRTQITENTKFMVRRLSGEIKQAAKHESKAAADEEVSAEQDILLDQTEQSRPNGGLSTTLLAMIFIALATIAYQQYNTTSDLNELEDSYAVLTEFNAQENALLGDVLNSMSEQKLAEESNQLAKAIPLISWGLNADFSYGYGEPPLSEAQVLNIQNMVFQLDQAGFKGLVELDIHLGNYCVQQNTANQWVIAADDLNIADCTFLEEIQQPDIVKNYITTPYIQFEQTSAPILNGNIDVLVSSSEFENPLYSYPSKQTVLTAGKWNMTAAKNNRLSIFIEAN